MYPKRVICRPPKEPQDAPLKVLAGEFLGHILLLNVAIVLKTCYFAYLNYKSNNPV